MNSFNQLMAGFGVVTVMNARIYKLCEGSSYKNKGLTPFDFEDTGLYLDTLKLANFTQEGPTKVITGGQYNTPLLRYGKKTTLEMQNALGNVEVLKTFFGCDYDEASGVVSVTDRFPSSFAIEGETFFINQRTGAKEKVWIFIPQFLPDAILNLSQDAEGDAATFDCNGTVCVTNIADTQFPDGHSVFYHIASKPWLRFGYMITPDSILDYRLKADNTYEIAGLAVDEYEGDIVIPSVHAGKRVTSIGVSAFNMMKYDPNSHDINLNNIYIPSSIVSIEDSAFCQTAFKRIHFGGAQSNLRRIMDSAFAEAVLPKNFAIPDKVNYIGEGAFDRATGVEFDEQQFFAYVGKWLVGYNYETELREYPPFRDDTIGIAAFAIPEIMNESVYWLPSSVKYVGRQDSGAAHAFYSYYNDDGNTGNAGYLCQTPEVVDHIRADVPIALVCMPIAPSKNITVSEFVTPIYTGFWYALEVPNSGEVWDSNVEPLQIMADWNWNNGSWRKFEKAYPALLWNPDAIKFAQGSGGFTICYNNTKAEAILNGFPWLDSQDFWNNLTIEAICTDGTLTFTHTYDPGEP